MRTSTAELSRPCKWCGETIHRTVYKDGSLARTQTWDKHLWCCTACWASWVSEHAPKTCDICGTVFGPLPVDDIPRWARRKRCGQKCSTEYINQRKYRDFVAFMERRREREAAFEESARMRSTTDVWSKCPRFEDVKLPPGLPMSSAVR